MPDVIPDILNFFRDETGCDGPLTPHTDLVVMTCNHEDDFSPILTAFGERFAVDLREMDMRFHLYPELRGRPHVRPYIPLTARLLAKAATAGEWCMEYPEPPERGWSDGDKGWGLGSLAFIAAFLVGASWAFS